MSQFARQHQASEAYQFLSNVLPWPPAGKDNFMSIHWSYKNKEGKIFWAGRAYKDLDLMTQDALYWGNRDDTLGVYVCMASQRTATPKVTQAGKPYMTPSRILPNAAEHKSFYIDVDVKEKAYATTEEAIKAASKFISDAKLPPPSAGVLTGSGGFHLHWLLDKPIPTQQWKPYADALANAVRQHGFIADTQCTVDAVRILRIPNTFNKKSGVPVPVVLLRPIQPNGHPDQRLFDALKPYLPQVHTAPAAPAFAGVSPLPLNPLDRLGSGLNVSARPVYLDHVAKECPFVATALATGGKDYDEPKWNYTTLLSVFMEEGRDAAHKMASGHPEYTRESTDAKFTRKEYDKTTNGVGPPSCQAIAATCSLCQTCPHLHETDANGKNKGPLHYGYEPNELDKQFSIPAEQHLPPGYVQDVNHRLFLTGTADDGGTIYYPLTNYAMKDAWVLEHPWILRFETSISGQTRQIYIPLAAAATSRTLAPCLGEQGVSVTAKEAAALGGFFVAWINKLQETKKILRSTAFGWALDGGEIQGFTYAGKTYTPNGEQIAATTDRMLAQQYKPEGKLDTWRAAAKLITDQGRPELDCILASAAAAPLIFFTGEAGVLVSAYSSDSGIGKTSAMKISAAMWGHPVKTIQALDDSNLSVIHKVGNIRSLPLLWDEIKTEDDITKFIKLAFQITSGKEKSRLTQNIQQREVGTWETMLVVASNETLIDHILRVTKSTDAGIDRMFEFRVLPGTRGQISITDASAIVHTVHTNYGHAGAIYAEYLGNNFANVEKVVKAAKKKFEVECKGTSEERYWLAAAAALFVGAMISNKLNLTQIDLRGLEAFLIKTINHMRYMRTTHSTAPSAPTSIRDLLGNYLSAKQYRHTLLTDNMVMTQRGKPPRGGVQMIGDWSKCESVEIHISKSGGMRISTRPFKKWLEDHGENPITTFNRLEEEYGAKYKLNLTLGAGTPKAIPGLSCLEFRFYDTQLEEYLLGLFPPPKEEPNDATRPAEADPRPDNP